MGAAIFIWDHRGRFDAERTLRMLHEHPITTFFAPPTAYRMLVQQDLTRWPARALRHCLGAGEAVNPEVIATWKGAMGHHIWEGYGQTETVPLRGHVSGHGISARVHGSRLTRVPDGSGGRLGE